MIKIYKIKKFRRINGGYTIIETMVAISLFLVVIMFGMTALLNANLVHRKTQDMRSILDNMSFMMEDMSKNMRVGYNFQCFRRGVDIFPESDFTSMLGLPRSCADGWAVAFESSLGNPSSFTDQWVYYLDSSGRILKSTQGGASGTFIQLTPDEVIIEQISGFSVLGALPYGSGAEFDSQQPLIIIKLSGTITYKGVGIPFSIETAVSQRAIDT